MTPAEHNLLARAYEVFNARDLDAALALMHPDVTWPNGWEGGYVHGHAGVRDTTGPTSGLPSTPTSSR